MLFVALTLMFAFLTACSPSPTSNPDLIDDLGTLADSNGDIEATLEIASVGSRGKIEAVQTQMGVVGRLTGTLTVGQKTVNIEGITAMDDWMPQG
jgi:hypothetical protein